MKKKVLVVGAGSGIGKALFDELKNKTEVLGISRRGKKFTSTDKLEFGINYYVDLLIEQDIIEFKKFYLNNFKSIDTIYFCQGSGLFDKVENISTKDFEEHIKLNLTSNFILIKEFFSLLKKSKQNPFVCFLSSTAGKIGFPESTAYCSSKHAVSGFAKSLREEWKKEKIRVFTVFPGAIATEIWNGREGFSKSDMIKPKEFTKFLSSFIDLPKSIVIDESYVLPMKGIL